LRNSLVNEIIDCLQGDAGGRLRHEFQYKHCYFDSSLPPSDRGKVLGINTAAVYTGLSLGPVLGGILNRRLGWESIFYFVFLIGVTVLFLTATKLKGEWVGAKGERYDKTGAFLYMAGMVAWYFASLARGNISIPESGAKK